MAGRQLLGVDVFNQAIERMVAVYEAGHRPVVSFSGGKDSCCVMEVCILAARLTNRLPVEVVMQDEEINFPGTYEYALRVAKRPEVKFHWLVMKQPMLNIFNRASPYFWVFDDQLKPEQWVRSPPTEEPEANVMFVKELDIEHMTIPDRFPPAKGKTLMAVIGLRVQESRGRMYGLFSSKGYVTGANKFGVKNVRPIYDWNDGDVWKAILDNSWDYNSAYDGLRQMGVTRKNLRVAPPTMNAAGVGTLGLAAQLWPRWFDQVCERLPGVRTAAAFGRRCVSPQRRHKETWEDCFKRECLGKDTPDWIKERALKVMEGILSAHSHHSTQDLPQITACYTCHGNIGSWRALANALWGGDPFSVKCRMLPYVQPDFFREGAGTWEGKPNW